MAKKASGVSWINEVDEVIEDLKKGKKKLQSLLKKGRKQLKKLD